jgi:hypothetical protein
MGSKSRRRRRCGVLVAVCTGVVPAAAAAQSSPIDRIEGIERGSRTLQASCSISKTNSAKPSTSLSNPVTKRSARKKRLAKLARRQIRRGRMQCGPQRPNPRLHKPRRRRRRPMIATADGRRSLALGGLMQFDMGGYFQNVNPNTEFPHLNNGVNLRRGRLYFLGTFDDFTANITPDFGDRPDGVVSLFEANDNYIGIKPLTRSPSDITILGSRWTTRQIPPMSCFSSARASSTSIEGWRQV